MRAVLAMAGKDLRLLVRDRMGFFFTFCFPLVFAIFFGVIFSGEGGTSAIPLAVVDEDGTDGSREFVETLRGAAEFGITEMTRDAAIEAVRKGDQVAYVILPAGFGASREHPFWGERPAIEIGIDPARRAEAGMVRGALTQYLYRDTQEAFTNPASMRDSIRDALAESDLDEPTRRFLTELNEYLDNESGGDGFRGLEPVAFAEADVARAEEGPSSAFDITFPQGILWGILSCAFGFALSLVVERRQGTLVRIRIAPVTRRQILAGKALACFIAVVAVTVVLLAIAIAVFGVRPISPTRLAVAIGATAVGFVGVMMVISVLGKTEASVGGFGWALMMVMAMTGGGMVPLMVMPGWLQTVGSFSPVKWAIFAMEAGIWREVTMADMALPCGVLVAIGVVGFAIGARVFRWTEA